MIRNQQSNSEAIRSLRKWGCCQGIYQSKLIKEELCMYTLQKELKKQTHQIHKAWTHVPIPQALPGKPQGPLEVFCKKHQPSGFPKIPLASSLWRMTKTTGECCWQIKTGLVLCKLPSCSGFPPPCLCARMSHRQPTCTIFWAELKNPAWWLLLRE